MGLTGACSALPRRPIRDFTTIDNFGSEQCRNFHFHKHGANIAFDSIRPLPTLPRLPEKLARVDIDDFVRSGARVLPVDDGKYIAGAIHNHVLLIYVHVLQEEWTALSAFGKLSRRTLIN